jgi:hypothetical protein
LLDSDGSEITLGELIDKYYHNPEDCFVKGYPELKEVDDSNSSSMTDQSATELIESAAMAMATRNNVNYQHQNIQKNFLQNHPTLWKNVLTEFPRKT